jgi:hypothetical protein
MMLKSNSHKSPKLHPGRREAAHLQEQIAKIYTPENLQKSALPGGRKVIKNESKFENEHFMIAK